ncbi:hypothetical protein [Stenotrophomonas nitritireducens]|uniref:hypothetical protein n=1 Tax=Stenotrophomonas nitritireducens TaxID=83617 RepID=UPI003D988CFD
MRNGVSAPPPTQRAAGCSSRAQASSTSACSAGMPALRAAARASSSAARALRHLQGMQRQRRGGQPGHGRQRGRHALAVEPGQRVGRRLQPAEQQQAPRQDQPGLQGIGMVAARLQQRRHGLQRRRRAAELAHRQRHLGVGQRAARAGQHTSWGPNPRWARRSRSRARPSSPSRAMAMPRRASAAGGPSAARRG